MGKRGSKPKNKVKIEWSQKFAYAIGLLTTDGNLSPDRRHINFTSKDKELILIFKDCLRLSNKIGRKARGENKEKKYYVIQFGDVNFYKFLLDINLDSNKSKNLRNLRIPDDYFFDFLRGHFDGDGTFYSYWDSRWKSSFMFYTNFVSASKKHVQWLRDKIYKKLRVNGHITKARSSSIYNLRYAKGESLKLLPQLYPQVSSPYLRRKYLKIKKTLGIIGKQEII
jgi:hypothetical protein